MVYKNFSKYDIDIENSTVYSFVRKKLLTLNNNRKDGYVGCCMTDDKGNRYDKFHQVVFCITRGITKDEILRHNNGRLYEIDHINGIRNDNRPENLRLLSHKDNINNPITRERLRKFGEDNPNYGKHLSEENKRKIGEATRQRLSKRIDQIDPITGEVLHQWHSMREAAREGGFCAEGIKCCCQGKYSQHHGYIFKWLK
jgi:hypothetical protein